MKRVFLVLGVALAASFSVARPVATAQTTFMQYYNYYFGEFCYGGCRGPICCGIVVVR